MMKPPIIDFNPISKGSGEIYYTYVSLHEWGLNRNRLFSLPKNFLQQL